MSKMPEEYFSAREPRVSPATMVWLTEEVAPQGRSPAVGELASGRKHSGADVFTGAVRDGVANLRQGCCAGERQHGSGEECVGRHCVVGSKVVKRVC